MIDLILVLNLFNLLFAKPIELRGVVEGFFGCLWTYEDRIDLIKFSGENKYNAYIYAPKADSYHRDKWRIPYPEDKIQELKVLIDLSKENNVNFIFAVSPGGDLNYSGEKGEEDFQLLMAKLDSIYEIGGRHFAIFFDDIRADADSGKNEANFLNRVYQELKTKYSDVDTLITVPTDYWYDVMVDQDGNPKQYTKDFSTILDKDIIVLYTGKAVVCPGISDEDLEKTENVYNRDLGVWWNYPVNDYLPHKLALGPIEKLPTKTLKTIFFNPMCQPKFSKLCLKTGADYSNAPETYDSKKSWNYAIESLFKDVAEEMKVFASHSMHMEKGVNIAGPDDAPEFYEEAHQAVVNTKEEKSFDFSKLVSLIDEMENAADTLLANLEESYLNECKSQLVQFKRIIDADRMAVDCLKDKQLYPELKELRNIIKQNEPSAILSEKSAIKFIDEVIELFS